MKDTYRFLMRKFELPKAHTIERVIKNLSPFEKAIFATLVAFLVITTLSLLFSVNQFLLSDVPARGGSITEGVVGFPRFINPILATTDADRDLTALVYSGLLRARPDGTLAPDLAENYSISEDGLTYRFHIREDAMFHDKRPVTTDDVMFTILQAQDPTLKSPKRANWDGVLIEKINEREITFTLNRPYAPFLENTTIGILPSHIWKEIDTEQFAFSERNTNPIGSGPYKVHSIKRNNSGVPEEYVLGAFGDYTLGRPYIDTVTFKFYTGEDELIKSYDRGRVEALNSIAPESLLEIRTRRVEQVPLPRIFAVFYNQNQAQIFSNTEVRAALEEVVDKERIVNEALSGYATIINSPIPPGLLPRSQGPVMETRTKEERRESAIEVLERGGWEFDEEEKIWKHSKKGVLSFSLATSNVKELKAVAETLISAWQELGIEVSLQIFEINDLNQNIIRPRKYDALLFGEIIGRELDLFAFWHSSQRNDPGLNIALYANIDADALLEKGRTTTDRRIQLDAYRSFEREVAVDSPALFLYSPDFIYVVPERIKGLTLGSVTTPAERFLNIHEWYIETDRVWNFFAK